MRVRKQIATGLVKAFGVENVLEVGLHISHSTGSKSSLWWCPSAHESGAESFLYTAMSGGQSRKDGYLPSDCNLQ